MEQFSVLQIETIAGGYAIEQINSAISEVLENCKDINFAHKQIRKIKLEIGFLPSEDRTRVGMTIKCETKLAPAPPITSLAYLGKKNGKVVAYEHNPDQDQLFEESDFEKKKSKKEEAV